jgi:hypothetical protein
MDLILRFKHEASRAVLSGCGSLSEAEFQWNYDGDNHSQYASEKVRSKCLLPSTKYATKRKGTIQNGSARKPHRLEHPTLRAFSGAELTYAETLKHRPTALTAFSVAEQ